MITTPYRHQIEGAGHEHGLDPDLIEALVICESIGCADAFRFERGFYLQYLKDNPKYAGHNPRRIASSYGLCQVMFTTAQLFDYPYEEPEYLFIPAINLEYGCRILGDLLEWADGDAMKALAGYNGGKGGWTSKDPQDYCKRVIRKFEEIQAARP